MVPILLHPLSVLLLGSFNGPTIPLISLPGRESIEVCGEGAVLVRWAIASGRLAPALARRSGGECAVPSLLRQVDEQA